MGWSLSGLEDPDVAGFLSSLRLGTRNVYGCGLKLFGQFYADKGAVSDFWILWSRIGFRLDAKEGVWSPKLLTVLRFGLVIAATCLKLLEFTLGQFKA